MYLRNFETNETKKTTSIDGGLKGVGTAKFHMAAPEMFSASRKLKTSEIINLVFGIVFLVLAIVFLWRFFASLYAKKTSKPENSSQENSSLGNSSSAFAFGYPV